MSVSVDSGPVRFNPSRSPSDGWCDDRAFLVAEETALAGMRVQAQTAIRGRPPVSRSMKSVGQLRLAHGILIQSAKTLRGRYAA